MANGVIGKVTAGGGTHLIASTAFGTCSTATSNIDKVATIYDADGNTAAFTLQKGITVNITMVNAGTIQDSAYSSESVTLNVNGTGAKRIKFTGSVLKKYGRSWEAGETVTFAYNGTEWVVCGNGGYTALNNLSNNVETKCLHYSDSGAATYGELIRKEITFSFQAATIARVTCVNPGIGNFYPIAFVPIDAGQDFIVNMIRFKNYTSNNYTDTMETVSFIVSNLGSTVQSKTIKGYLYALQVSTTM